METKRIKKKQTSMSFKGFCALVFDEKRLAGLEPKALLVPNISYATRLVYVQSSVFESTNLQNLNIYIIYLRFIFSSGLYTSTLHLSATVRRNISAF